MPPLLPSRRTRLGDKPKLKHPLLANYKGVKGLLVSRKPICIACEDTKKNSKGGQCVPCLMNGRIK